MKTEQLKAELLMVMKAMQGEVSMIRRPKKLRSVYIDGIEGFDNKS